MVPNLGEHDQKNWKAPPRESLISQSVRRIVWWNSKLVAPVRWIMKSCIFETRHCNTFHKISQRKSEGSNCCRPDTLILKGVLKWIRLQYMMLYGLYATSNSETVIYGILHKFHKKWTRKSRVQRDYKVKFSSSCHLPFHLDMCSSAIQPQPRTLRRAPKPSVDVVATCFASVAAPDIGELFKPLWGYTLPETNVAPENRPSQKETSIPSIHVQGRFVSFREGNSYK